MQILPIFAAALTVCLVPLAHAQTWGQPEPARPAIAYFSEQPAAVASTRLRLEEAWALAEEHSPALRATRAETTAADGLLEQAGVRPNPELDVTMEDTRADRRTTTVTVSIPIELGGKREARVQVATADRDLAQQELENARSGLRAAVAAAFFQVGVAQERLVATDAVVGIAQRALDAADKQVTAGKLAPLERIRARVEVANAGIAQREARTGLRDAKASLSALWGQSEPGFAAVDTSLDALPVRLEREALRRMLVDSPQLASGRLAVERSRAALAVERSKRFGDVRLTVGMARESDPGRNVAQLGVSFPLPLNDTNRGNIYAAALMVQRAEASYQDLTTRSELELGKAVSAIDSALESARDYQDALLPSAQLATDAAHKAFTAGKVGFTEVLDVQRTFFQARMAYLDVLSRAYQSYAELDRLTGRR